MRLNTFLSVLITRNSIQYSKPPLYMNAIFQKYSHNLALNIEIYRIFSKHNYSIFSVVLFQNLNALHCTTGTISNSVKSSQAGICQLKTDQNPVLSAHMCVLVYVCMCVCLCVCMYACVYMCAFLYKVLAKKIHQESGSH